MKYAYKSFQSNVEIDSFFNEINNHIYIPIDCWYKQDELKLYGYFYDEENKVDFAHLLLCFGQTICPDTLPPLSHNTIFSELRRYGSSRKYKGLKDVRGNVLLRNMYDDIDFFYATENNAYFIVSKGDKKGVVKFEYDKFTNIAQPQFDDFFDAGEYTFGYVKENNVGFMSLDGKFITEAKFRLSPDFNHFIDGRALACLTHPDGIKHYINHYGDCIGYPEDDFLSEEHGLGTGYYPYGDLPDALDAYEGDETNFWNTD